MSSANVPPNVPQPPLPPSHVPPQRPNQAVLWIVVILGCCVAATIVAGLLFAHFVIHRVNIRNAGHRVAIETPVGSIQVNKAGSHATGLPVYPGAIAGEDEDGGSVEINGSRNDTSVGLATETYRSDDPIDKVEEWYRHRLGPEFHFETGGQSHERHSKLHVDESDHERAFVDDRDDGARIVALDRHGSGTKITLVRVGKRDTQ